MGEVTAPSPRRLHTLALIGRRSGLAQADAFDGRPGCHRRRVAAHAATARTPRVRAVADVPGEHMVGTGGREPTTLDAQPCTARPLRFAQMRLRRSSGMWNGGGPRRTTWNQAKWWSRIRTVASQPR